MELLANTESEAASCSVSFETWTGSRSLATIGTNAGSLAIPFQNWRTFKEAFAPELIQRAISETGDVATIFDPFGGSGTTALAGQFLGARPTTIEVNPFLADLIAAKVARYDFDELSDCYAKVRKEAFHGDVDPLVFMQDAPPTFLEPGVNERFLFSRALAGRFFAYRKAIEGLTDVNIRRLFLVLLCGFSVAISNARVSGKGRRYRSNWQTRQSDPNVVDVEFEKSALNAIKDLRQFENRSCTDFRVLRGDARELVHSVTDQDLSVFSPPYPNSFDYTDVYNIELWMGGYLRSGTDNRNLRMNTLRSHVQINRNLDFSTSNSLTLRTTLDRLSESKSELWSPRLPGMVGAYFHDMVEIMAGLRKAIRPGGRVYMVVGDSRYAGVDVPVAKILSELVPDNGFDVLLNEPFRSMRASPQQGGKQVLAETLIVLRG
ncbi:MAG: hypothetical protein ABJ246_09430 [Paracoccaceae bacterium]